MMFQIIFEVIAIITLIIIVTAYWLMLNKARRFSERSGTSGVMEEEE